MTGPLESIHKLLEITKLVSLVDSRMTVCCGKAVRKAFLSHASICEAAFHSWKRQGMRKEKKKTWKTISLSILWNIWHREE
ncbi:hypothetical protein HAX54_004956 [Datura stramonium]|uniref:Uncharacterized protein n=1 Tax=Datura stramonium TaxID=4076 RepID=A0ABS8T934_DATST|nr:hypothetical protein [Datura stramonium]